MEPSERDGDLCEVWGHPPLSVRWPEPIVGPNVSNHKVTCQVSIKVMDSQPGTSDKRGQGLIIRHQDSYRSFLFHGLVNLSCKDFSAGAMTARNVEPCLSSLLRVPSLEDRRPSPLQRQIWWNGGGQERGRQEDLVLRRGWLRAGAFWIMAFRFMVK